MRNKSVLFNIYFSLLALLTAAACVFRSIALLRDMNYASGHFEEKLLIGVADKLVVAAVIFALSYAVFAKRGKVLVFDFASPLNYIFAGTLGSAVLLFAAYALKTGFASGATLIIITGFFAILSTVHFVFATLTTAVSSSKRADFGIITAIFLALYSAYLYFDASLPINSPIKIVDEMTYISAALFFLYETRISIGREKWPRYTAFGFTAMILCAYSAIPSLIAYIAEGRIISNSIFETVLTLAIMLFCTGRLALSSLLKEHRESSTVSVIKAAENRSAELETKEKIAEETTETADKEGEAEERYDDYYGLSFGEEKEESASEEIETEINE